MTSSVPRRDLFRLAALLAGGALLPGCAGPAARPTGPAPEVALSYAPRTGPVDLVPTSLGTFAAALLDGLGGGNAVVSPVSVAAALAMLGNGAAGTTRAEFEAVLGSGMEALNAEVGTVLQALRVAGSRNGLQLTLADAVWAQRGLAWQQAYLDVLAGWYEADVRLADFRADPAAAVAAINAWAEQSTKGLIPSIVDESMITSDTRLAVANAVHFKGAWDQQFDPARTVTAPFTTGAGGRVDAALMVGDQVRPWRDTPLWSGTMLPFSGGELAMALLLPKPGAPASLAALTAREGFPELLGAPSAPLQLAVPRWRARTNAQLAGPLAALGLRRAFESGAADFSAMTTTERLFVQFVAHEATITVDETGAEAAAVTVGGAGVESAPLPQRVLRLDRPFHWAILHTATGTPLFLGRVDDPTR